MSEAVIPRLSQANKMELHTMKEAMKIRIDSHEACERILSLKEGWHIVMEKDRDQLTGNELMGGRLLHLRMECNSCTASSHLGEGPGLHVLHHRIASLTP